jgi:hypothetical protein
LPAFSAGEAGVATEVVLPSDLLVWWPLDLPLPSLVTLAVEGELGGLGFDLLSETPFDCPSVLGCDGLTTTAGAGAGDGTDGDGSTVGGAGEETGSDATGCESAGLCCGSAEPFCVPGETAIWREPPLLPPPPPCSTRRGCRGAIAVGRTPSSGEGDPTTGLWVKAIASWTLPALLGPSGIGPLKTAGKPSWEMNKVKPSPTAATAPTSAIEALRSRSSMPSPARL